MEERVGERSLNEKVSLILFVFRRPDYHFYGYAEGDGAKKGRNFYYN